MVTKKRHLANPCQLFYICQEWALQK